ncbi:GDPGTP exchange factor Sec2p [Metarhizium rileyi]|uniref:Exosome 3'->5 exonuclease subunit ski4 (Csl4) n=1 Tax=Metarhizium rileyi (strain RCEF 4871) TaxID=1649241 RepID=A0A162JCN1_METRR|nr:GDPGTP exchange factor Sec2p [Metarhizium rileyi RCEF 4871]TWU73778.1 exosome 3'->5 exonuclease subunit ski4 (Csl4) [Metarhizium rileyi]
MTMTTTTLTDTSRCAHCGSSAEAEVILARQKIAELESIITDLNAKASDAIRRCAKYDEEIHSLRAQSRPSTPQRPPSQPDPSAQSPTLLQQSTSRLSALLYPRKSTSNLRADARRQNPSPLPGSPLTPAAASTEDLIEALTREQTLRKEAEGRLSATSKEVEELSVSLFEQANEMVATERRARAKLEARVDELEKRDGEKKKRLERLEAATARIARVRSMLEA